MKIIVVMLKMAKINVSSVNKTPYLRNFLVSERNKRCLMMMDSVDDDGVV